MSKNTNKLRPLSDRIVVKRDLKATTTAGGIYIPSSVDKPIKGTVIAVGNGKTLSDGTISPIEISIGDIVLFGKLSGTEVQVDEEEFLILREEEIMAIVK